VRLLARVGDADTLQRSLKVARSQLSQKTIDHQQLELRTALSQYWELRKMIDTPDGTELARHAKRKAEADPVKIGS
jgi:hypothetical protein